MRASTWIAVVLGAFVLLASCASETGQSVDTTPAPSTSSAVTTAPAASTTTTSTASTADGVSTGYCEGTPPTSGLVDERPSHIGHLESRIPVEYVYREFLQMPIAMAWGPDDRLYVADWTGQHVVVVESDGSLSDLGVWRSQSGLRGDGPRGLAFDSSGCLYVNNHSQIFQVDISTGYSQAIDGVYGSPIGSITISPDDELYYTDRGEGEVRRWVSGSSETVADGLPSAENLVFDQAGNLFVAQMGLDTVMKVDVETGEVTEFRSGVCRFDPCFLAVDADGDLWVRAIFTVSQVGADGELKPYVVDGTLYDGTSDGWHSSAGIAVDGEGGIFVGSYNSWLKRLAPVGTEGDTPEFTLTDVSPGFEASDLAMDSAGNLYAANENRTELLRIGPDGAVEVLWDYERGGRVAVAVSPDDRLYMATGGDLVRFDADGSRRIVARVATERMVFAGDGELYVAVKNGPDTAVVRVDADGSQQTIATRIAGSRLSSEIHLAPAADTGLYVFDQQTRDLFFLDFSGEGHLITNLRDLGGGGPVAFAASPRTGEIFYLPHGPYTIFAIGPDGEARPFASNVSGDPWGMVVGPDGQWLYVAESGAIDKLAIP